MAHIAVNLPRMGILGLLELLPDEAIVSISDVFDRLGPR